MNNFIAKCYQPNFTVLNDNQVLVDISGGVITRLEERATDKLPTYLAIRRDGKNIYFQDLIDNKIHIYDPISMSLFHRVCDLFCSFSEAKV